MYRWLLDKIATGVARYPRTALGLVVGYVLLSFLEIIPIIEIITDFMVVLSYVLIRLYIAKKKISGAPFS